MDDITKKLLRHEASSLRDALPPIEDHLVAVHNHTHATQAHLIRLGICPETVQDGRLSAGLALFGMLIGRLIDCQQSVPHIKAWVHALKTGELPAAPLSDSVAGCLGTAATQQLNRLGQFAIGELRLLTHQDSDEWNLLAFLVDFFTEIHT